MGVYINPPDVLKEVGRQLQAGDFKLLASQLNSDEVLFGLYDRGFFKNATQLYPEREMAEMTNQVVDGIIIHEGFFAVKTHIAKKYVDCELMEQQR